MLDEKLLAFAKQANCSIRGYYDESGWTPQEIKRFADLVEKAAYERAAIACWNLGMDKYKGVLNLVDWRIIGSEFAKEVRKVNIDE